ncbi:MAG: restriction endonuclease [Candidatus Tectomicrobia bacterium]|nr:restriction endonuclease [Candidatus Tectomicrobia bacterium]
MPIPDFQSLMLPALTAFAAGVETPLSEVRERVAAAEGLTDEEVREILPSGRQPVFGNRVSWAVIYMERAGLLERVRRGVYRLTQQGELLLSRRPSRIDISLLGEYPDYVEWAQRANTPSGKDASGNRDDDGAETPEEALDRAARQLRSALEADVLHRVRNAAPTFLERVVVDLLIEMGYGGGDVEKGRVTGRSGDGGIDGTIQEDALGLDEVYVQAKKYAEGNSVGEGDLRNFAGAIDAAGTTKGVFVTTAGFTRAAKEYVARSPKRIALIDGEELSRLMVQHGIGVRTWLHHEIKRVDEDYFEQEVT